MYKDELHRVWCIRNDIKIYPIRLETTTERYKIGITINNTPEEKGDHIYPVDTNKTTIGVYDKIKEMQQYFFDLNKITNNDQQQPTTTNSYQQSADTNQQ
ncbi:MAG: hypothetical protein HRT69_16720 [Flavobacteriaceae bacterium]|nr:hypothetical protein [Flavobacteriaceae bacterium]